MGLILKYIFLLCFFYKTVVACSGDCASCHPNIDYINDKRHSSMLTCLECHDAQNITAVDMGPACGQDCFACHDAGKINQEIEEHKIIKECIECHTTINKSTFIKIPTYEITPIKNFLKL